MPGQTPPTPTVGRRLINWLQSKKDVPQQFLTQSARVMSLATASAVVYQICGGDLSAVATATPAIYAIIDKLGGGFLENIVTKVAEAGDETADTNEVLRQMLAEHIDVIDEKLDELVSHEALLADLARLKTIVPLENKREAEQAAALEGLAKEQPIIFFSADQIHLGVGRDLDVARDLTMGDKTGGDKITAGRDINTTTNNYIGSRWEKKSEVYMSILSAFRIQKKYLLMILDEYAESGRLFNKFVAKPISVQLKESEDFWDAENVILRAIEVEAIVLSANAVEILKRYKTKNDKLNKYYEPDRGTPEHLDSVLENVELHMKEFSREATEDLS